MYAKIQWREDVHFEAQADSGHLVPIDGPPDGGGKNRGSRPMELVLMGLGGCAAYDVISILAKSRQKVTDCVTHVTASRVDEIPQVFDRIHLKFVVTGHDLDPKKVARAVELSADKYCSASRMLEAGGVEITHSYEVVAA
ncbi:MAG: OsmC family protein [Pseudomonadales bacterium]